MRFEIKLNYSKENKDDNCPMIMMSCNHSDCNLEFDYSNIRNMYTRNRCGCGIQVNDEKNYKELLEMCGRVADVIYESIDKLNIEEIKK